MRIYVRKLKVNLLHDCITIVLGKVYGGHRCPTDSFLVYSAIKHGYRCFNFILILQDQLYLSYMH